MEHFEEAARVAEPDGRERSRWADVIPSRRRDRVFVVLVAVLVMLPPSVDLSRGSTQRRLFSICAADAFYYLTVARNIAETGRPTLDGVHLTNGYHPLWQLLTGGLAAVTRILGAGDVWTLGLVIALGIALTGAAALIVCLAINASRGSLHPSVLLVPLGAASVIQAPLMWIWWRSTGRPSTTLWGAVNGMETSAVLLAYAICALLYVRLARTRGGGICFGLALSSLMLARLDHAIFSICLLLGAVLFDPRSRPFWLAAAGTFGAALLAYLSLNRIWFGTPLPVSGMAKSTFPFYTTANLRLALHMLRDPKTVPMTHAHRVFQMLIPACAALFTLARDGGQLVVRKPRWAFKPSLRSRLDEFTLSTSVAALVLFLYNFYFVIPWDQGHWYFPVSNLFVTLTCIASLERLPFPRAGARFPRAGDVVAACIGSAVVLLGFSKLSRSNEDSPMAKFFFDEAPLIRKFYGHRRARMVEYDDGIVTFSTGIPAMSGLMLAIDAEALKATWAVPGGRRAAALLDLAISRGYDRFATFAYPHGSVDRSSPPGDIRDAYKFYIENGASGCKLRVEYRSRASEFAIIKTNCRSRR